MGAAVSTLFLLKPICTYSDFAESCHEGGNSEFRNVPPGFYSLHSLLDMHSFDHVTAERIRIWVLGLIDTLESRARSAWPE